MTFATAALNCVFAGIFVASVFSSEQTSSPEDETSRISQLIAGAKQIEPFPFELSPGAAAQIEKSIGEKLLDSWKRPKLFQAKAVPPEEKTEQELHIVFIPLEKLKNSVLVMAGTEKQLAAAQIVQDRTVNQSWKLFLDQFVGPWGVRLDVSSANPPSQLAEQKKKASPSGDENARKLYALFTQKQLMWQNGILNQKLFESVRARSDRAPEVAKDYAKLLGELVEFSPKMNVFLEPDDLQVYQTKMKEMKKWGDSLSSHLNKKEWEPAMKALIQTQATCGKCHGWDANHYGKPLEGVMANKRADFGIGRGYFVVDYDLQLPEAVKKEEAQLVANAVKSGLWLLKFSFERN